MNGVEVAIYASTIAIGVGMWQEWQEKRRERLHALAARQPLGRTWVRVQYRATPKVIIPVRVVDGGRKELVYWLNAVRDTPFETYDLKSYADIMATVTPDEAQAITQAKEFLS